MIAKKTETGKERLVCDIRRAMKVHMESDIYIWCAEKDKIVKTERKTFDQENKEVGKTVILTYIS